MAKRVQITNQGMALIASSSQATGQYYWLGYYAPAYVPSIWKATGNILFPTGDCGMVNGGNGAVAIGPTDTDNVSPTMSMLTKYGDMVYNVWQGDLTGTGYANGISDGSPGADLYGMTMYDKNVKKHYRYVMDSNGNNTLVAWIINTSATDGSLLGKHVYKGTDGYYQSTMPIPAPLYYLGDTLGRSTTQDYFTNSPYFDDEYYNGAKEYPYIAVELQNTEVFNVPKISIDYRLYNDSNGNASPSTYPFAPSIYFDANPIPSGLSTQPVPAYDDTAWYASDMVQTIAPSEIYCTEFWKLHTISNYNRFHASVDSIGHVLNTDLSNRNMAKATKLFPISNYKVITTETGYTANNERVEVATAIKVSIDLDLSPNSLQQGLDGTSLDQNSNLGYFDLYQHAADGNPSGSTDQYGNDIYTSVHNSFKFNRIGIYAVPLRSSPIMSDNGFGYETQNEVAQLQFQINPDAEPILYAVIDWDNTVVMSDTGDGIHQFKADFDINLQSLAGVSDTPLIRDAAIFYNMYQDDAQTWYENQLIATASTSNAVTELGLEIANLKSVGNSGGDCCPPPDLSNMYALKDHTHSNFLRNIIDSVDKLHGGLRGIDSAIEGTSILGNTYALGLDSIALGKGTATFGDTSIVASGVNNYILSNVISSAILAGNYNTIQSNNNYVTIVNGLNNTIYAASDKSTILGGYTNYISGISNIIGAGDSNSIGTATATASYSFIGSGISNYISDGNAYTFIGAGQFNSITSTSPESAILAGDHNIITISGESAILTGDHNGITSNSGKSVILTGAYNTITSNSGESAILAGDHNTISNYSWGSVILTGTTNNITTSPTSIIGSGTSNYITNVNNSIIGAGDNNIIQGTGTDSFIGAGSHNYINESSNSSIVSGTYNTIATSSYNAFIGAGTNNYINGAGGNGGANSFIGAGESNGISASMSTTDAVIVAGKYNYIQGTGTNGYAFIGNGLNNIISSTSNNNIFNSGFGVILNGNGNYIESTIANSIFSFIGTGSNNYITDSSNCFILSGYNNVISSISTYSGILGGSNNKIINHSNAFIVGNGITVDRDNATFVNSLALTGSSLSMGSQTPMIGTIPTVQYVVPSVPSNLANLTWQYPLQSLAFNYILNTLNCYVSWNGLDTNIGNYASPYKLSHNIYYRVAINNTNYVSTDNYITNLYIVDNSAPTGSVFFVALAQPTTLGTLTCNILYPDDLNKNYISSMISIVSNYIDNYSTSAMFVRTIDGYAVIGNHT